ncbi:MAG: YybS family protein [Selenomonas sp.]|nr:YybS family protein [Selenomonas sp.]
MNQHRITPLTESGLLTALSVVLALMAVYLPFIGFLLVLFWPLPLIVLVARHGLRWGIMATIATGVLLGLFVEPMLALRLVLAFAPAGVFLGWAFARGMSGVKSFLLTVLVAILGQAATIGLLLLVMDVNPLTMQVEMLQSSFDTTLHLYEDMGMSEEALATTRAEIEQGMQMLNYLFPLVFMIMGLIYGGIAYVSGGKILRRLGHDVPQFPPVHEWRLPVVFLYLFGFALVGLYWGGSRQITWLYQLSLNANALAILAGLLQGLVLLHYLFRHYKVSLVLRIVFYLFITMNPFLAQVVSMTGLIDMIFDYRQRFAARNQK